MSNQYGTSITTNSGIEILKTYASTVYLEDLANSTTFKNLNSVSIDNNQLVLAEDLALNPGDVIRVDSGDFEGIYIVTKYDTGSHTITISPQNTAFKSYKDTTYSDNNPKVYKIKAMRNNTSITSINIPGSSRTTIDVTSIEDRNTRTVNGRVEYEEINVEMIYDSNQPISVKLNDYYNSGDTFALWFTTTTNNISTVELFECQVNKIGGRDLKPGGIQKQTLTLNVNGHRFANLKVGV